MKKILIKKIADFAWKDFFNKNWLYLLTILTLLSTGVGIGFITYQNNVLFQENSAVRYEKNMFSLAYTRTNISLKETQKELYKYKKDLEITEVQKKVLAENLGQEKEKVADQEKKIDTLEKLTTIDPELLKKYSKIFFLSENYVPKQLFPVPDQYKYYEERDLDIDMQVWPYLQGLLLRAQRENIALYILSGYRSFGTQSKLKSRYSVTYGAGTANQFSADQGYSEHQLGTTVDFITTGIGGQLYDFNKTNAYKWLEENAHEYGFTLSYPEKNGYYIFEPWHWRFVGIKLATNLYKQKKNFHDLSQREIDKYLLYIFD